MIVILPFFFVDFFFLKLPFLSSNFPIFFYFAGGASLTFTLTTVFRSPLPLFFSSKSFLADQRSLREYPHLFFQATRAGQMASAFVLSSISPLFLSSFPCSPMLFPLLERINHPPFFWLFGPPSSDLSCQLFVDVIPTLSPEPLLFSGRGLFLHVPPTFLSLVSK